MRRELDNTDITDPSGCGVDKKGDRHAEGDRDCDNIGYDQEGHPYCIVLAYARLDSKMQKWMWMPQMLDYFWTKDVEDGFEFLKESGFVWTYRYDRSESLQDVSFNLLMLGIWPTKHLWTPRTPTARPSMLWNWSAAGEFDACYGRHSQP